MRRKSVLLARVSQTGHQVHETIFLPFSFSSAAFFLFLLFLMTSGSLNDRGVIAPGYLADSM